jgi:uncharacterized membrane protein YkoI
MIRTRIVAALALAAATPIAHAGALEDCLEAAQAIQSGDFLKLEYLDPSADGEPAYEIELRTAEGREWEFMCDAEDGTIFEIEQEVSSPDHPLFMAGMKVSLEDAKKKVMSLYPGEVEEVEYEIEANGDASYEMDVVDGSGTEFKIEVDAATGDIIEVAIELWEIGEEADER